MAEIKAFRAWRPKPDVAPEVACVPYDVISTDEARDLAKNKDLSFLHVIRPEIDLPEGTGMYSDAVYEKGKENLKKLLNSDAYLQEDKPGIYIYRLTMNGRSQTGVFTCVSVKDYDNEVILKHELTRPEKEDDRTRHILTQQAHAEPVMMTFKDVAGINELMEQVISEADPLYDFRADDHVQHTIWKADGSMEWVEAFGKIPHLYIADGHHRCASASRVAETLEERNTEHTGDEEYNFFTAALFPMNQMEILAYNRIVYDLPDNFFKQLTGKFNLKKTNKPEPQEKGQICLYLNDNWYSMPLPESAENDAASKLDVSRLQEHILTPFLGIKDQRTNPNIDFVGGIRGTDELESLVDNGEAALAISMYPTDIQELMDVSDAGLLMPPKSTWFEPKLRSGLLVHTF